MNNGATPLIIGTYVGQFESVQQLLQQPTINKTLTFENKTALQWAQPNERTNGLGLVYHSCPSIEQTSPTN